MKKFYLLFSAFLLSIIAGVAQESDTIHVVIETNVGTMKAILYNDVPNHVRTFVNRARQGEYNGTLFTRVIPEFMIQGGAPDSKTAPAGARCGFGDPSAEILPEINEKYFRKRGALAAPRQPDDINPQKKSDMSQFFIVQGKVYRNGELDTLEGRETLRVLVVAGGLQLSPEWGATLEPGIQVMHGGIVRGGGEIAKGQFLLAISPDLERCVCFFHKKHCVPYKHVSNVCVLFVIILHRMQPFYGDCEQYLFFLFLLYCLVLLVF